jgi:Prenyltransferase and squalene oxidase repeat
MPMPVTSHALTRHWWLSALALAIMFAAPVMPSSAQDDVPPTAVLSDAQWGEVDASVERGLAWLASQQQRDGSFPTLPTGQPGVTSLCVMAFLAHGHVPGTEPYGPNVERALDYILNCQKENGLITFVGPRGPQISRQIAHDVGSPATYNHAISSLTISELYGMSHTQASDRMEAAITKSLAATLEMQNWPKQHASDKGGWRYINKFDEWDSDLSVTGWYLMFLRSARNAGFDVPAQAIDEAVKYIRDCFDQQRGTFMYINDTHESRSRGMAGAGILALAHAGFHHSVEAEKTGQFLLRQDFTQYNQIESFGQTDWQHDRYHYAVFNCCQGMYQLGGRYWSEFFPPVARTLVANQQRDGSWPADIHIADGKFGNCYTSALVIISLGAPNQLLPIFQR